MAPTTPGGVVNDLADMLEEENLLSCSELGENQASIVADTAQRHLAVFLGEDNVGNYDGLLRFALSPWESHYGLTLVPDGIETAQLGEEILRSKPTESQIFAALRAEQEVSRGTTFLVRTFLYLAYADAMRLPFAADEARSAVVASIVNRESTYLRDKLLSTIRGAGKSAPAYSFADPVRMVSPFSAIVLSRAGRDKANIPKEIQNLRRELTETRKRIATLEAIFLCGTRDEAIAAEAKWQSVLAEASKNFGPAPGSFQIRRLMNFGTDASEAIGSETDISKWLKSLAGLPLEAVQRYLHQRPIVELHKLRAELPGPYQLENTIANLFGSVRD